MDLSIGLYAATNTIWTLLYQHALPQFVYTEVAALFMLRMEDEVCLQETCLPEGMSLFMPRMQIWNNCITIDIRNEVSSN